MWTTTVAAWSRRRLVDVCCGFFLSRLLRSSPALRTRRKHADVPCLPLVSATARAYYQIHVLPDMRRQGLAPSLCRLSFLTRTASACSDGCQRVSGKREAIEGERKITAHHRLVVREREGVARLSGAAFEIACATIVRLVFRRVEVADRQWSLSW